jgi:predicted lipoprotein with Yx(FWY)xxD motif
MASHHSMMGGHLRIVTPRHATLTVEHSKYGNAIFAANGRVLYAFGPDKGGTTSHCYGVCAQAWPPVLTSGAPRVSGGGLQASLVGETMRKDVAHQVTYGGRPLYYYSGDKVGSVRCQHVVLHGGLWLILEPSGHPNMMMGSGM